MEEDNRETDEEDVDEFFCESPDVIVDASNDMGFVTGVEVLLSPNNDVGRVNILLHDAYDRRMLLLSRQSSANDTAEGTDSAIEYDALVRSDCIELEGIVKDAVVRSEGRRERME